VRNLSSIILSFGFAAALAAQNPHGADLKIDCASCHSPKGWEISASYWQNYNPDQPRVSQVTGTVWGPDTLRFHHGKTGFALTGRHATVDCRGCHENLVFSETPSDCNSCHSDVHQQTVGTDCARCHTTANWLIDNIPELHVQNGFPLTGVHQPVSCEQCHTSAQNLQFNRIGNDCISCHLQDYQATTQPNHQQAGYSTNCLECHDVFTPDWGGGNISHDFFPLTKGHEIADCRQCHVDGNFSNTPNTCNACHSADFTQATNPNHTALNIPNDCAMCHTTEPEWEPATFPIHNNYYALNGAHAAIANNCASCHNGDYNNTPNTCNGCHNADYTQTNNPNHAALHFSTDCAGCHTETAWAPATFDHDAQFFPIYSGKHNGEWSACTDCHTNPSNYAEFSCTGCHTNPQTNNDHNGIGGYTYNSQACLACHPTGSAADGFDHNTTDFPLTGAHLTAQCVACHATGYAGTPTQCSACHTTDFNQSTNPNHAALNFPTDCAMCHTTAPNWAPATFPIHNNYYALNGAHAAIANNCASCHNGNYNNTPNTCFGCHAPEYNSATNPNHAGAGFPNTCENCHTESAWEPSTFNHDQQYFRIYSGNHKNEWNQCVECHTTPGNFSSFSCIDCHEHDNPSSLAQDHQGVSGYQHVSSACYNCHPNGN